MWAVDQLFALAKCSVQRHRKPLPQIGKEARHRAANSHPPPSPSTLMLTLTLILTRTLKLTLALTLT